MPEERKKKEEERRKKKRVRNKSLPVSGRLKKKKLDTLPSQTAYPAGFVTWTPD